MVTTFSRVVAVKTEVVVVDEGHVILVDHEEALHLCVCVCVCIYLEVGKGKKTTKNSKKAQFTQLPFTKE